MLKGWKALCCSKGFLTLAINQTLACLRKPVHQWMVPDSFKSSKWLPEFRQADKAHGPGKSN